MKLVSPSDYKVFTPAHAAEAEQFCRIVAQCFNAPIPEEKAYIDRLGHENFRLIEQSGQLIGGLQIYRMGQWYGGRILPIAGIAAVAIAPELRGTGAAVTLLADCLREFHRDRIPLAVLYASTQQLYRKVGFEQAGTLCQYSVMASGLRPGQRNLLMSPIDPGQTDRFVDLYQQQARTNSGNLERHPAIWKRFMQADTPTYAYLIGPETSPQGYVIFNQQPAEQGYNINLRDVVTLTSAAQQRLWSFLADHRSVVNRILWKGPIVNPTLLLLPEQTYQVAHLERWFVRVVDVPGALSQRGYPCLDAELHLEIHDELIPENHGRFVLTVNQGQGQVIPGGHGELQTSIRGLSPLFTGLLSAQQLQQLGYLEGAPETLALASLLFSGPEPWMPDHF